MKRFLSSKEITQSGLMLDFISSYGPLSPMVKIILHPLILNKNAPKWLG
ncbi:hypothetical protein [Acinetobacter bereziniae]|nr:hypothetical protein [Acinetobacter bereziniae]MBJ8554299.1 hypothetical protein [Acinetobacter bereziniae]MDR6543281.1 hypothetical protein [Acinetobacter bereziniae]